MLHNIMRLFDQLIWLGRVCGWDRDFHTVMVQLISYKAVLGAAVNLYICHYVVRQLLRFVDKAE